MILPRATSVERSLTSGFSNVTLAWGEENGSRFCLVEDYSIKLHEVGLGAYSVSICWTVQQRKKHIYSWSRTHLLHQCENTYYGCTHGGYRHVICELNPLGKLFWFGFFFSPLNNVLDTPCVITALWP